MWAISQFHGLRSRNSSDLARGRDRYLVFVVDWATAHPGRLWAEEAPPIRAALEVASVAGGSPGLDTAAVLPTDDLDAVSPGPRLPVPVVDLEPGGTKPRTRGPIDTESRYEEARTAYRKSVEDGRPLTGKALGDRFGMSDRWGRDRIAEVKQLAEVGER